MLQRSWSQPNPHRLWGPVQIFTLAMAAMCIQCARFWTPDAWDGRRWSTSGSGIGFTGTCSAKLVGGCNPAYPAYPDCAMFQWHFHMLRVSSQCALHARVSVMFSCRFIFDLFQGVNQIQHDTTIHNHIKHHQMLSHTMCIHLYWSVNLLVNPVPSPVFAQPLVAPNWSRPKGEGPNTLAGRPILSVKITTVVSVLYPGLRLEIGNKLHDQNRRSSLTIRCQTMCVFTNE